jgi:hypothetical protein
VAVRRTARLGRLALLLLLGGAAVGAGAGCSRSGGDATAEAASTTVRQGTVLRVADIPAAVAAVEAALGGPQQYAEINATPEGVNLFVRGSETEELAYFYRSAAGGEASVVTSTPAAGPETTGIAGTAASVGPPGPGVLEPPDGPTPLSSTPFALEGVDLAAASGLVQQVQDRFPGSEVVQAALVQVPDQGLVWGLRSRSALGGLLNVFFNPDGRLLAVDPVS